MRGAGRVSGGGGCAGNDVSEFFGSSLFGDSQHFSDDFGDGGFAFGGGGQRIGGGFEGADAGIQRRNLIQRPLFFVPIVQEIRHGLERTHWASFEGLDDVLYDRRLPVADDPLEDERKEAEDGIERVLEQFVRHHFVALSIGMALLQAPFDVENRPFDADPVEQFDGEFHDF